MAGWGGRAMGQTSFFDLERRLDAVSAMGDPLETIKTMAPPYDVNKLPFGSKEWWEQQQRDKSGPD